MKLLPVAFVLMVFLTPVEAQSVVIDATDPSTYRRSLIDVSRQIPKSQLSRFHVAIKELVGDNVETNTSGKPVFSVIQQKLHGKTADQIMEEVFGAAQ